MIDYLKSLHTIFKQYSQSLNKFENKFLNKKKSQDIL